MSSLTDVRIEVPPAVSDRISHPQHAVDKVASPRVHNADSEPLFKQAADVIAAGMDVACIRIWLLSTDRTMLELQTAFGPDVPFDGLGGRVPVAGSELGQVVQTRTPHVISCVDETVPDDVRSWAESARVASFFAVPMRVGQKTIGVLAVFSRVSVDERSVNTLQNLAGLIARASETPSPHQPGTESDELLQSLVQCLPSAVITLDGRGLITRWSAAAESLFGWSAAEVCGKPLPFVLDERRHEYPDDLTQTLRPGRVLRGRTICRRADESRCHVQRSTSLLCDRHGETAGRVEVFVDESHRVQTTRCLQIQAQVTRIVTGCRRLDEAAPLFLAAVSEWLGCEASEFWTLDEKQDALSRVSAWAASPDNRDRLEAAEIRVHAASSEWPAEAFQDGRTIYRDDIDSPSTKALSPVRGALRIPVGGVAIPIGTDQTRFGVITCLGGAIAQPDDLTLQTLTSIADAVAQFLTRLRTEAALSQTESNLRQSQKMDAIGLLAGGVAHDFNNLLTIILAYSEMGLGEVDESHELHELFAEVHGAGERAAAMTKQLLAVSRQQPTQVTTVHVNHLVSDMERMLQRLVGTSITLTCDCEKELVPVQADANQLEQVLLNLVVNARDAMPDGGTITVRTSNVSLRAADISRDSECPGDYVKIDVSDTGCGMDAATQARIFEPFFTTKDVGRGTGMGLSTVFGIIKQSDGFIRVESELDKGTTFSVLLPQSLDVLAVRSFDEEPNVSPVGTERILVVESDAAIRNLIRRLLEVRGYSVEEAIHGGEALEKLKKRRSVFDLVLTDIQTPVVNGVALARKMQELPTRPKLMMMSGNTEPPADLKLDQSWQFLPKPFTSDALAQRVRTVLDADSETSP